MILPAPGRSAPVDSKAGRFGNASPWVAVGGMEPSAAQIESHARDIASPGPSSGPRYRLKHHRGELTRRQPSRRGNTRSARSDYHDVRVSAHLLQTQ